MQSVKNAQNRQLFVRDLGNIVTIYQQLAVMDMQTIRNAVLETRGSMDGLLDIFFDVHEAQRQEVEKLLKQKQKIHFQQKTLTSTHKNGKNAIILITPEAKFSGTIGRDVFDTFASWVQENEGEVFLFGQLGQELYKERFPARTFTARDFPQNKNFSLNLQDALSEFFAYERVDVFHGRFLSLVQQTPQNTNVTGDAPMLESVTSQESEQKSFLFEPSLEEIITFFEAQLFAQLLQQTFREAKLAHLGSRISSLESALSGIEQQQQLSHRAFQKAQRQQSQRKQLQRLAGAVLWS